MADWSGPASLVVSSSVDSTNAQARRAVTALAQKKRDIAPTVFVAWHQTAGRGRGGRRWESPAGDGVYASVLVPVVAAAALEALPLLLPVLLCRALRAIGLEGCGLKWPNDLVVDGRKLGGLLIESVSVGSSPQAAILGFGINYRTPESTTAPAVGLVELLDSAPALVHWVTALLEPLVQALAKSESHELEHWVTEYRALTVHRSGDRLTCRTASEQLVGDFIGFDCRGFLRLKTEAGERTLAAGDLIESSA